MGWENAVCKVERDDSGDKGTGWLCSEEGYVITAGHLFIGEKEASPLRPDNNNPITATLTFSSQTLKANLVIAWRDDENTGIDAAILRCEERPGIEPLKVISEEPENQKVTIYGCGDESDFRFEAAYGTLNGQLCAKAG